MIHHWLCSVTGYKITVLKMDVVIFALGVRYAQEVGFMIGFVQLPTGYKKLVTCNLKNMFDDNGKLNVE